MTRQPEHAAQTGRSRVPRARGARCDAALEINTEVALDLRGYGTNEKVRVVWEVCVAACRAGWRLRKVMGVVMYSALVRYHQSTSLIATRASRVIQHTRSAVPQDVEELTRPPRSAPASPIPCTLSSPSTGNTPRVLHNGQSSNAAGARKTAAATKMTMATCCLIRERSPHSLSGFFIPMIHPHPHDDNPHYPTGPKPHKREISGQ